MMNTLASNFLVAARAVLPIFIIMGVGMLVRHAGIVNEAEVKKINKLNFVVFFPLLMFTNLYGKDISDAVDLRLMVFGVAGVLAIYALTVCFVVHIAKERKTQGAMIQAIYRSNFVIMGIPIVANIFGDENLALTAVMVTVIVPLYNVLAVITLEVFRGGKPEISHILKQLAKNPLILGALAGIVAVLTDLKMPSVLENVASSMAGVATPLALLTLGAFFDLRSAMKRERDILICVAGRLIAVPAIGLTAGILLGFRGVALVTLIAIFASPTAVSSFPMAQEMDSDYELAGDAVVFSSGAACFTMFLWIFALKSMGMF